jgi:drug/metabolite transporter (DMT)-like permease
MLARLCVIFGLEIIVVAVDILLKQSSIAQSRSLLLLATVLYLAGIPGWYWVFSRADLGLVAIWGGSLYLVLQISAGALLYHERITTERLIACCLVLVAIYLAK